MNASNSRPAEGRGARGRGRKWWMWGNQFYFWVFFLPWAPANVCIFRRAGGGEVATEGGKDGGKGDELQAFPCFFFFLWWGDRKRAAQGQQLSSQHPANRVEGGKWDFQVRGSDVRLASSLFVFPLEPCFFLFYFFMSLQTKPANQTCPDMASPGFSADFLFLVAAPLTRITPWPTCFIPKKHHPTRITSCVPVQFPSSERCPTVYLSVCDISMATNIRPRS